MNESKLLNEGKSRQSLPFFNIDKYSVSTKNEKLVSPRENQHQNIRKHLQVHFTIHFFFPLKYKFLLSYSIYDYHCMKR